MSFIEKLKSEFPTQIAFQTAFQIALYTYVYNKDYKKDLKLLKESLDDEEDLDITSS